MEKRPLSAISGHLESAMVTRSTENPRADVPTNCEAISNERASAKPVGDKQP